MLVNYQHLSSAVLFGGWVYMLLSDILEKIAWHMKDVELHQMDMYRLLFSVPLLVVIVFSPCLK